MSKILLLDIETAPNRAYIWSLWDKFIPLQRLEESRFVICWAAKWSDEKNVRFRHFAGRGGELGMLKEIHRMLDQADVVVHYNGKKFDIPVLNAEFATHGLPPPSPYKQVDLCQIVQRSFSFVSSKLEYVLKRLDLSHKIEHEGFDLWVRCMSKDKAALSRMGRYNRGDVVGLEELYRRLLPWITQHPNQGIGAAKPCCPKCGSVKYRRSGLAQTAVLQYPRYKCLGCGGWFRSNKAVGTQGKAPERFLNII